MTVSLDDLRAAVLTDAVAGAVAVSERLADQSEDQQPATRAALLILLTEAQQRDAMLHEALTTIEDAARAVKPLPVNDPCRLAVLAVRADLTVCLRQADAVNACDLYAATAGRYKQPHHQLISGALRAIAVYHSVSAATGRTLLTLRLARLPTSDPARPMLAAAVDAASIVTPRSTTPPGGPLPALPGAILQPVLEHADHATFARRIALHPGAHGAPVRDGG